MQYSQRGPTDISEVGAQSRSVMSSSWCGLEPARLLCPSSFPGKNTGVGCHFLLQGIFPTQGSTLCLLHWQGHSLLLHHLGSPISEVGETPPNSPSWDMGWPFAPHALISQCLGCPQKDPISQASCPQRSIN